VQLERLYLGKVETDASKATEIKALYQQMEKEKKALIKDGQKEMDKEIKARRESEAKIHKLERDLSKMSRKAHLIDLERSKLQDDHDSLKTV
jgi:hypothetical protein